MLTSARAHREQGADVVIGVVETHGRVETEEQIKDLEIIPPQKIMYRGNVFDEMDLDAIVRRKPAVVVAPMTRDGKIILIRQERIPIGQAIWEMPSGQIDDRNSDEDKIKDTALRELREETGYELPPNGELISLGYFFSSPGFTDERCYFFLARPVQPSAEDPDRDEGESILDCRGFSSEEICRMIAENEIRDANTLGICATLAARGLLSLAPR